MDMYGLFFEVQFQANGGVDVVDSVCYFLSFIMLLSFSSPPGGLENAVHRAVKLGARSFGLFLRPQRQWSCKPLTQEAADRFRQACRETGFAPHQVLPHGSYLLNCGSPDQEVLQKSRAALVDELRRCEMLGLVYYNFHPGGFLSKPADDMQELALSCKVFQLPLQWRWFRRMKKVGIKQLCKAYGGGVSYVFFDLFEMYMGPACFSHIFALSGQERKGRCTINA